MSGIAGIIHLDGRPVEPGLIESMTAAMAERGPDGIDHWSAPAVALGQCMLHATPESLDEKQPLANEDESVVLALDGRLDNWEELRATLLARGVRLRDRTDAELVLRAYEVWGKDCVARIEGDFAFAIWNARTRSAFCATDQTGIRMLFYHFDGQRLVFASEPGAILRVPGVPEVLNQELVAEYLSNEWHSLDQTFWQEIFRLPAANRLVVNRESLRRDEYWSPELNADLSYRHEEDYVEHYCELFADVVRRQSRSHRPLACEVSGGLDSSAIFAMAHHLQRQGTLLAPGIDGYTLSFEDDPKANEIVYARAVRDHVGGTLFETPPSRMSLDWYRRWAARFRDFPSYPNGVMGFGIREAAAGRGARVVLSGVGGDEWLRGRRSYYSECLAPSEWSNLYQAFMLDSRECGPARSLGWFLRYGVYSSIPLSIRLNVRRFRDRNRSTHVIRNTWLEPGVARFARRRSDNDTQRTASRAKRQGQRDQFATLKSARLSRGRIMEQRMAAETGVELRLPYFSQRIVQFAFSVPQRWLLRGKSKKNLHRKALTGLLPESVRTRSTCATFGVLARSYLPSLQEAFVTDANSPWQDWVTQEGVMLAQILAQRRGRGLDPVRMLWALFGCDAVARSCNS